MLDAETYRSMCYFLREKELDRMSDWSETLAKLKKEDRDLYVKVQDYLRQCRTAEVLKSDLLKVLAERADSVEGDD